MLVAGKETYFMKYFNNPQSIGQLRAEYDQLISKLQKESLKNGDSDKTLTRDITELNNEYNMWLQKLRREGAIEKHSATVYFKNPKTLEELDNQYRIYIRKLSSQKGGDKLLEQIEQEYKRLKKEIKYNNGQYTLIQKLHREILEFNEQRAYTNDMQEAEKRSYRNRKYTKEDIQNLVTRQKQIIYKAITIYLKQDIVLKYDVSEVNNSDMMEIVHKNLVSNANLTDEFEEIIKETAYVLEALALQSNTSLVKYNYQMEQIIGEYAKKTYLALEEKYADPIKIYDRNKALKRDKKSDKFDKFFIKIMWYMLISILPVFLLMVAFSDFSFNHDMTNLMDGIGVAVFIVGVEIVIGLIIKYINKRKLKKRIKARTYDEL